MNIEELTQQMRSAGARVINRRIEPTGLYVSTLMVVTGRGPRARSAEVLFGTTTGDVISIDTNGRKLRDVSALRAHLGLA